MALSRAEISKRYRDKKSSQERKVYYRRWITQDQFDKFDCVLSGYCKVVKNTKANKDANT